MDWTLEVVVVPVTDVDRAKTFYIATAGAITVQVDPGRPSFQAYWPEVRLSGLTRRCVV